MRILQRAECINGFYILVLLFVFGYMALTNVPSVPARTHELAAFLYAYNCDDCGLGKTVTGLISAPSYFLLSPYLISGSSYYIFSIVFMLLCMLLTWICILAGGDRESGKTLTKITVAFFLLLFLLEDVYGLDLSTILGLGVNLYDFRFTNRSILSLFYMTACFFLMRGKVIPFSLMSLFAMLSHPTNGMIIFTFCISAMLANHFTDPIKSVRPKTTIASILILSLGLIPPVLKFANLDSILLPYPQVDTSLNHYILSMYRDEIDDFSAIYQVLSGGRSFYSSLIFSLSPLVFLIFVRKDIGRADEIRRLAPLIYIPILMFLVIMLTEYIFLSYGMLAVFVEIIINAQLGGRILAFSGIPALFIWTTIVKQAFSKNGNYISFWDTRVRRFLDWSSLTCIVLVCIVLGNRHHEFFHKEIYDYVTKSDVLEFESAGRMAFYKHLIDANFDRDEVNKMFIDHCSYGQIYSNISQSSFEKHKKTSFFSGSGKAGMAVDKAFEEDYMNLESRESAVNIVNASLPKRSSVVTPPYFYCFREFLVTHDVYFQEHDDGNFMLGSKKIFDKFTFRMQRLNFDYIDLPAHISGLMSHKMRQEWLGLTGKSFRDLRDVTGFDFLLTESEHDLDLPIMFKDDKWALYKIL